MYYLCMRIMGRTSVLLDDRCGGELFSWMIVEDLGWPVRMWTDMATSILLASHLSYHWMRNPEYTMNALYLRIVSNDAYQKWTQCFLVYLKSWTCSSTISLRHEQSPRALWRQCIWQWLTGAMEGFSTITFITQSFFKNNCTCKVTWVHV